MNIFKHIKIDIIFSYNILMNLVTECKNYPVADRIPHQIQFGCVDKTRGEDTMDPIVTLEDNYYWLRDDTRKNKSIKISK